MAEDAPKAARSDTATESSSLIKQGPMPFHRLTLPIHWAVSAVDGCDARLLPSLFRVLEHDFGLGPKLLSALVVSQSLAAAFSAPVWGQLADTSRRRIRLLGLGTAAFGLWTLLSGLATAFWQLLVLKVLTGCAISAVTPISQSVVADIVRNDELGRQFGIIGFWKAIGSMVGGGAATAVGYEKVGGLPGWRVVIFFFGGLTILLGILAPLVATDPRADAPAPDERRRAKLTRLQALQDQVREARRKAGAAFRLRTFQLIVLQGVFGSIPWSAMSFVTMWLQYIGLSDQAAGVVVAINTLGCALGSLLGGWLGDQMAARFPDTGRVWVAQASVLSGILLSVVIFTCVPWDGAHAVEFAVLFFVQGLCMSWCFAATNRPIFSELAPPATRATLLAWAVAIEGSGAAILGAPLVGWLAEDVFGYDASLGQGDMVDMPPAARRRNADAISQGLLVMMIVPWTVCFLAYGGVAYTYPRDRDRLNNKAGLAPAASRGT